MLVVPVDISEYGENPLGHDFTKLNFSHSMNPMVQAATVSATWPSRRTARPQKAIKRHFCATAVDVRHY